MGLFDKLRNLDKVVQDLKEEVRGTVNRAASGTDWPRASDPDGIDVLAAVTIEGRPFRMRSEGTDASGWEYRERQVVESYDTWDETRNKGRLVGVTWVEILHLPAYDAHDLFTLGDRYGNPHWRADAADMAHLTYYLPRQHVFGKVPATGDPCMLVWLEPAVLRIRTGSVQDHRGYGEYGENSVLRPITQAVLGQIDLSGIAQWAQAIEPWRDRFDATAGSTAGGMAKGALDAIRGTLSGEAGRRAEGEDGRSGGLLGRVLGAANHGAGAALGKRILKGKVDTSKLQEWARSRAEAKAQSADDEYRNALITHLDVAERSQPGERWVELTDAELTDAVATATGLTVLGTHDRIEEFTDSRFVRLDGNHAATVTFAAPEMLVDARNEIDDAKTVGDWTIGTSEDRIGKTTMVAVGPSNGVTIAVRVSGAVSPMTALKLAKAIDALLKD